MLKINIFDILYSFSRTKKPWLILLVAAFLPFSLALFFQHCLGLSPCVLCIYQRVALLGICLASLLGLLAPTCRFLRTLGLLLWGYSAFRGLLVAWEQTQRYLHPSQFTACSFRVRFPELLPLDSWIPQVFKAYAACEPLDWSLLGLNMPQWMVLMFSVHLAIVGIVACSQIIGWRRDAEYQHHQK